MPKKGYTEFTRPPESPPPWGDTADRRILRHVRETWGNYNTYTDVTSVIKIDRALAGLPLRALSIESHCQALGGWVGLGMLTSERGATYSLKNVLGRLTMKTPFLVDSSLEDDLFVVPERLYSGSTPAAYATFLATLNPIPGEFARHREGYIYGNAAPFFAMQAHYGERPASFPEKRAPLRAFYNGVIAPTGGALTVFRMIITGRAGYSIVSDGFRATNTWVLYGVTEHGNFQVRTQLATGTDDFAYTGAVAYDALEVDMNDTAGADAGAFWADAWD